MRVLKKSLCVLLTMIIVLSAFAILPFAAGADEAIPLILGDANRDGEVDIVDVTTIQRCDAKMIFLDETALLLADVDKDGEVCVIDAAFIQRWLIGKKAPEGIGETLPAEEPTEIEHKLLKKVESYYWDYQNDDWTLSLTTSIDYENAYPVLIEDLDNYEDAVPNKAAFEYTFDGEKPLTRVETNQINSTKTIVEYNDGRVYNYKTDHLNSGSYEKQMYQYGNGDEYFTMVLHDDLMSGEGYGPDIMKEEVDSVTVTTENGLLKRTTNTGIYTKWAEGEKKKWVRFRGIYSIDYDSDGIASFLSAVYSDTGFDRQGQYEVKKENGKITEITRFSFRGNELEPYQRFVFEYNDTEISPARYSLMINYFITGHGGNYYYFNWY